VVEETTKERRDKGVEDNLGTTVIALVSLSEKVSLLHIPELRKSHPEDKDELEGVVECYMALALSFLFTIELRTEPVDGVDGALEQGQETERNPVL